MAKPHLTFGHLAVGHLAGWHFAGSGGYLLYRGVNDLRSIDYRLAVGFAQAESSTINSCGGLEHVAGLTYYYGIRAVGISGRMDNNTHAIVAVRYTGLELQPVLPRPGDVQLVRRHQQWRLCFRVAASPGQALPDRLEVLQSAEGTWLAEPLVSLPAKPGRLTDYDVALPLFGGSLAVRARLANQAGPISSAVFVPAVLAPSAPSFL